jgi:hypothetical protein
MKELRKELCENYRKNFEERVWIIIVRELGKELC